MSETDSTIAWLGPPEPGAHNREVYGTLLGIVEDELATLEQDGII